MNEHSNTHIKDMTIINYIYDEEFIGLINRLSKIIKEYFNNYELYIANLRAQYDSINEQTLFSKSAINDILQYLNQSKPKLSINTSEKYLREKAFVISERIDNIIDIKNNIGQNVRSSDLKYTSFANEAKDLFKKMKLVRSHKIDEINAKYNFDEYMMEKKRDKYSSQSPKSKFIGEGGRLNDKRRPYQYDNNPNHNNTITMEPLSNNINKRSDSFSPFGSVSYNNGIGNQLSGSLTIEDIMKKNEVLIAEITLIKYKHSELEKENKALRDKMIRLRQGGAIVGNNRSSKYGTIDIIPFKKPIIDNIHDSFNASGRASQTKSRSISKKSNNNYVCTTTLCNEFDKDNCTSGKSRLIKENHASSTYNTLQSSSSSACNNNIIKEPNRNVVVKRALSIGGHTKSTKSNSQSRQSRESSSSQKQNPLTISSNSNSQIPCLSNSNSINNNLCINNSITANNTFNTSFPNNSTLATLVLSFISQMKSLQENIANRSDTVKDMKKSFEIKKRELIKLSEAIISAGINNMTMSTSINSSKKQSLPPNTIVNKAHTPPSVIVDTTTTKLDGEIAHLKLINQESEARLFKDKTIISQYEIKLSEEKNKAKILNESITALQLQLKEMSKVNLEHNNTIESLDIANKDLLKIIQTQGETMTILEKDNESYKAQSNTYVKEASNTQLEITKLNEDIKALHQEITTYKNEIMQLKRLLTESKAEIITMTQSNEILLAEKDIIINTITSNTLELNKDNEALSNELTLCKEKIVLLQKDIKDYKESIPKTKITNDKEKEENDDLIKSLKDSLSKYQKDLVNSKQENRDLMNKIAQIKNDYLSYDQEKEEIKHVLIELNKDTDYNIKAFQAQTHKLQCYKEEYSARLREKLKQQNLTNLQTSTDDYINTISLIKNHTNDLQANTNLLENKIKEASSIIANEQTYQQKYEKLKEEIIKLKEVNPSIIGKEIELENNNPNKTLSDINEQNSNFLNDELSSISNRFLEEKDEEKSNREKDTNIILPQQKNNNPHPINPSHKQCLSLPNIVHTEQLSIERKQSSQNSFQSNDDGKYQMTLKQMEESELLLKNQLTLIKSELKATIEERNQLQKKCDDSLLEMTKDEMMNILKQTFEKLVDLIQVTDKVKDYVMMIFKLLNYSDENIKKIMMKKEKKTLYGLFK